MNNSKCTCKWYKYTRYEPNEPDIGLGRFKEEGKVIKPCEDFYASEKFTKTCKCEKCMKCPVHYIIIKSN